MMATLNFLVNAGDKRLVSDFQSTKTEAAPTFFFGDKPIISVRVLEKSSSDSDLPWKQADLTGQTIRVGIGQPGGVPASGYFYISIGVDTTTKLPYNATAQEVEDALNLLPDVSGGTWGPCTVSKHGEGSYRVFFKGLFDMPLISVTNDWLVPASDVSVISIADDDLMENAIQSFGFELSPATYIELTDDIPAPSITITTVRAGVTDTTAEQQRVVISGEPHAGTYSLTIGGEESGLISFDATTDDIVSTIEALPSIGAGNVTVTGDALDYTIEFDKSLGDVGEATADASNLSGAIGKTGTLDLNTVGVVDLLNGEALARATFEIVRFTTDGSISETVYQGPCAIKEDVIPDTPPNPTTLPGFVNQTEFQNTVSTLQTKVVSLTQAEYDALTPDAETLYNITDA